MKDTKEYIIKTSLKLFMQKSFKEVTMKEIVDKTGLSKGAFYHYFASKEAVFEEVVKYFYSNVMITDYHTFPKTTLKEFYNAYLERLTHSNTELDEVETESNLMVFITEAARKIPTFQEIHQAQRAKEKDAWSNIVAIAKKEKEILSDLPDDEIALMFLNLSDGVALNRMFVADDDQSLQTAKTGWDNLYQLLKK